ncbi:MAG: GDP-mannose 4,6-dehydratase [Candidatus Thermoplasmatota archaeon]|jgi:GDPmannose 4,6-dehydratase|nr:GDP-mannose 4,6-dehydratase [Candidatus Thermoplasmatota archaeon]
MNNKKALITGISGQDGYFLSKLLVNKGYEVHGVIRRNSQMSKGTVELLPEQYRDKITIHFGDVTDAPFIEETVKKIAPDELYHLAAQSFVGYSFKNPSATYDVNIGGTLNVANAVKDHSPNTKLYFAATSELYGQPETTPQNEDTVFRPRSPYAISKLAGYWTVKVYRESYKLFMCNGILFNHESEVRGPEFVTRKIAMKVAAMAKGDDTPLVVGNLDARKDWGYAEDYVYGMWLMLQQKEASDYVLSTGEMHTVRDFINEAFESINKKIDWKGKALNETGIDKENNRIVVKVSPEFYRPLESDNYMGDYSKAKRILGWKPKVLFKDLVKKMVMSDLNTEKF